MPDTAAPQLLTIVTPLPSGLEGAEATRVAAVLEALPETASAEDAFAALRGSDGEAYAAVAEAALARLSALCRYADATEAQQAAQAQQSSAADVDDEDELTDGSALVGAGLAAAVVAACRRHEAARGVLERGMQLLAFLAYDGPSKDDVATSGAFEAVAGALATHPRDRTVVQLAALTLLKLTSDSVVRAVQAINAGAQAALAETLAPHSNALRWADSQHNKANVPLHLRLCDAAATWLEWHEQFLRQPAVSAPAPYRYPDAPKPPPPHPASWYRSSSAPPSCASWAAEVCIRAAELFHVRVTLSPGDTSSCLPRITLQGM